LRGYEGILRRADGQDLMVSVTAAPVRERPDAPVGLAVLVLRDVSEARRLDEARDEFLSTAAHELKTPLAVIKAYAQLFHRRSGEDSPILLVIERQVDRLSRLVQQLLEVARSRLGSPELRRERYDLGEQLAQVLERMQLLAGGHRFRLVTRVAAPVHADRARLEQVLVNLLDNAVRFSPGGGDIDAFMRNGGAEVEVSIRDAGVGIPPEKQARIFERFYRAHAGTPQDYGGLGVGLESSREIVARHGGRIWFESRPGAGSTFSFTLPIAEGGAGDTLA
jgi:signal transduction histidine kinase